MIQIKQYLKVAKLIAGNIMKSGNDADSNALEQWLNESDENKAIYQNIKGDGWYHENKDAIEQFNVEKGWHNIQSRITSGPRTVKLIPKFYKYAAAAILVVALASTYFLRDAIFNSQIENTTPIIVNNKIEPGIDKATLTLETGETIALEKGTSIQTQNATSNGEQIVYQQQSSSRAESRDNYLTIPRGGQFQLTLSDGTKVWLNSDTQLKYPVSFVDGESRQVELVYGEAYFDVSPSTAHKGADFKVFNNQQEVQVLGTEFNIKAYKDETHVYTTLVEGKVAVNYKDKREILIPNQQSNVNLTDNTLKVTAADVYNETSWKEGIFSFKEMPLKDIAKVLSRWYDVSITFSTPALEQKRFNGVLNKRQTLEEILFIIKKTNKINDYKIVADKQVIIM